MLIVGADPGRAFWQDGIAQSPMTGARALIEIAGHQAMDLIARAAAIAPWDHSPSAALAFAGVICVPYRHDDCLRLHVDGGLTAYLMDWFAATDMLQT